MNHPENDIGQAEGQEDNRDLECRDKAQAGSQGLDRFERQMVIFKKAEISDEPDQEELEQPLALSGASPEPLSADIDQTDIQQKISDIFYTEGGDEENADNQ
jgi:hypothetical protein